jgi:hypothetical protein
MQVTKEDVVQYVKGYDAERQVTYKRDEKHKDVIYPAVLEVDGEEGCNFLTQLMLLLKNSMGLAGFTYSMGVRDNSFTTTLAQHPNNPDMIHQGSNAKDGNWGRIIFVSNAAREALEKIVFETKSQDQSIAI